MPVALAPSASPAEGRSSATAKSLRAMQTCDAIPPELIDEARRILREVPLVDGHNDTPWRVRKRFAGHLDRLDFRSTRELDPPMHTDLRRMREGGVGAQFWSLFVPLEGSCEGGPQAVLEEMDFVRRLVARYPEDLELAVTAEDVIRIHSAGRIACLMGVEGGQCINNSLGVLRMFHLAGARYMTLAQWNNTDWADAATDRPVHGGLTPFGREVVREMNRCGLMVDLSHVSRQAMHDALDVSVAPLICSHSGARAVCGHPRNVPDDVLERIRAQGGMVMVNFSRYFASDAMRLWDADCDAEKARLESCFIGDPDRVETEMAQWRDAHPGPVVTLAHIADHVDHIRRVAGIDHVGIGSDFDGIEQGPQGLEDVSRFPWLLAELLRRGYTRSEVEKVAGLNTLRVMGRVAEVADRLQRSGEASEATQSSLDGAEDVGAAP